MAQTVENMAVEQVGKGKQQKKDAEEEASAFLELLDKVLLFIHGRLPLATQGPLIQLRMSVFPGTATGHNDTDLGDSQVHRPL